MRCRDRTIRLLFGAIIALLLAVGFGVGSAQAHALLLRSDPNGGAVLPREPAEIHLWFSENLNASLSRVIVWNKDRQEVDEKDDTISHDRELTVSLRPGLSDGSYLVLWTSVSAQDGHILKGAYFFSLGHPGPVPPAPTLAGTGSENFPPNLIQTISLLARALELTTAALWLGLAVFLIIIIPSRLEPNSSFMAETIKTGLRLLPLTLILLLLARVVEILIQAYTVAGDWTTALSSPTLNGLLVQSEFGRIWLALQASTAVALIVSGAALVRSSRSKLAPKVSRVRPAVSWSLAQSSRFGPINVVTLLLASLQTYLIAASGHAATVDLSHTGTGLLTAPVVIDAVHIFATGIWVGGIFTVSLVLLPSLKRSGRQGLVPFLDSLDRFSPWAYASVILLALTGGFNGKVHVPSWAAFLDAVYGRTLIVKILLVGLMILISAFTVRIVRPRLRRTLREASPSQDVIEILRKILAHWLRVGALLGFLVFVATAVLNAYPVPVTFGAPKGPFGLTARHGDLSVQLKLNPGKAGTNEFTAILREHDHLVRLADVNLLETMQDMNMGTQYVTMKQKAPGIFKVAAQVPMGGHWRFEVLVRKPNDVHLIPIFFRATVGE